MAQPKKRISATRSGNRRSHWRIDPAQATTCSHCGALLVSHQVCTACGYYKGKLVLPRKAK